jgi:hypothetical protein
MGLAYGAEAVQVVAPYRRGVEVMEYTREARANQLCVRRTRAHACHTWYTCNDNTTPPRDHVISGGATWRHMTSCDVR